CWTVVRVQSCPEPAWPVPFQWSRRCRREWHFLVPDIASPFAGAALFSPGNLLSSCALPGGFGLVLLGRLVCLRRYDLPAHAGFKIVPAIDVECGGGGDDEAADHRVPV